MFRVWEDLEPALHPSHAPQALYSSASSIMAVLACLSDVQNALLVALQVYRLVVYIYLTTYPYLWPVGGETSFGVAFATAAAY